MIVRLIGARRSRVSIPLGGLVFDPCASDQKHTFGQNLRLVSSAVFHPAIACCLDNPDVCDWHKATSRYAQPMSAFGGRADITLTCVDVCFCARNQIKGAIIEIKKGVTTRRVSGPKFTDILGDEEIPNG